jgi:hypothetical protein
MIKSDRENSLSVAGLAELAERTENEAVVRNAVALVRERKPLFQSRHGVSLLGSEPSVSGFSFSS